MSEPWTIGRLLTWTTQYLKDRGADSPRLDAEILLADARRCRRIELYTSFDDVPPDDVRDRFRELVRQRAEGSPVAYLVGRREFYSLSFSVTPDVLIPRPETELLIVRLLDQIKQRAGGADSPPAETTPLRIADVGTGSGALAIVAARQVKNARLTAIDISPAALEVARRNATEHGVTERIDFVVGDLLSALPADAQFDFIISNPPYVSESEFAQLAREVRDFEPRSALVGGQRGTEVIERLLASAADRLVSGGWLLTEISPMIEAEVRSIASADPRWELAPTVKDLAGRARVIAVRKK